MIELNYREAYMAFERLKTESRWSQCFYAYLTGGNAGLIWFIGRLYWYWLHIRSTVFVFCSVPRGHRWSGGSFGYFQGCSETIQTQEQPDRVVLHEEGEYGSSWLRILDVKYMEMSEVCLLVFLQAEKLRIPSLSKELCILSVIEILYLWKALANCSMHKLQTMTQGTLLSNIST